MRDPGAQREQAEKQLGKVRQAIARLIDNYAAGYLEKDEFEPRMTGMRRRVSKLEEALQELAKEAETRRQLRLIIGRLDDFSMRIKVSSLVAQEAQTSSPAV